MFQPIKKLIFIFLIGYPFWIIQGQSNEYHVDNISKDLGLSDLNTTSIAQDQNGQIWFTTRNKYLYKYDGALLEEMPLIDFNIDILDIIIDERNNLWLVKNYGNFKRFLNQSVSIFLTEEKKLVSLDEYLPTATINFNTVYTRIIKQGPNGMILIGDTDFNYYLFREGNLEKLDFPKSHLDIQYSDENVIITRRPLYLKDSTFHVHNISKNEIKSFTFDDIKKGIVCYDSTITFSIHGALANDGDLLLKMGKHTIQSSSGIIYKNEIRNPSKTIYTKDGAYIFDNGRIIQCSCADSTINIISTGNNSEFKNLRYNDIFVSDQENIWVATAKGLFKLTRKTQFFRNYLSNKLLSIRGLTEINENLIVSTNKGLFQFNMNDRKLDTIMPTLYFHGLDKINDHLYHIGMYGGYYRFLDISKEKLELDTMIWARDGEYERHYFATYTDPQDNIWVGGSDGLYALNLADQQLTIADINSNHPIESIVDIVPNLDSSLFYCLTASGLFEVNAKSNKYRSIPSLDSVIISTIYQESENREIFWIGSRFSGLFKWNRSTDKLEQWTIHDGLSNNNIHAIFEEENNKLWLSTDRGLNIFDKVSQDILILTDEHGLHENEFNRHAFTKFSDGSIGLGTIDGFVRFDPNEIDKIRKDIPLEFVLIGVDKKSGQTIEKPLSFFHGQTILLYSNFLLPKIAVKTLGVVPRIRYKKSNLDQDWIYLAEKTQLDLKVLSRGTNVVLLSYEENLNQWSIPKTIIFNKVVPFYQSKWFYSSLAFLILIGIGFELNRRRIRTHKLNQQIQKEVELKTNELSKKNRALSKSNSLNEQMVAIIGHDLRSPLVSLSRVTRTLNYLTKNFDSTELQKLGSSIDQNAQRTLSIVNELMTWTLSQRKNGSNLSNQSIPDIIKLAIGDVSNMANEKKVLIDCECNIEILYLTDGENLRTVIRNVLNNAIKFSFKDSIIEISIEQQDSKISICIRDYGIGIDQSTIDKILNHRSQEFSRGTNGEAGLGFGLQMVMELLSKIGGSLHLEPQAQGVLARIEL